MYYLDKFKTVKKPTTRSVQWWPSIKKL